MKTTLIAVFLLFCAVSAFGQQAAPVLPSQPVVLTMTDHPLHAEQHDMAPEQTLFAANSPYIFAQGEQPLWQFPTDKRVTPLGDVAREFRKEHEAARKAEVIWVNQ